jgi:hypothetical protein
MDSAMARSTSARTGKRMVSWIGYFFLFACPSSISENSTKRNPYLYTNQIPGEHLRHGRVCAAKFTRLEDVAGE